MLISSSDIQSDNHSLLMKVRISGCQCQIWYYIMVIITNVILWSSPPWPGCDILCWLLYWDADPWALCHCKKNTKNCPYMDHHHHHQQHRTTMYDWNVESHSIFHTLSPMKVLTAPHLTPFPTFLQDLWDAAGIILLPVPVPVFKIGWAWDQTLLLSINLDIN